MNNFISIIMNCYNGEKYLADSLKSVIKQKHKNWELIFWDNCSTDNSKKIFKSFKDKRFKYFLSNSHTTLYKALYKVVCELDKKYLNLLSLKDLNIFLLLSVEQLSQKINSQFLCFCLITLFNESAKYFSPL